MRWQALKFCTFMSSMDHYSRSWPFPQFSISRWNATLGSESNHAIESAVSENMGNDTKINSLSLILPKLPGVIYPPPPVAGIRNKISLPGRVLICSHFWLHQRVYGRVITAGWTGVWAEGKLRRWANYLIKGARVTKSGKYVAHPL